MGPAHQAQAGKESRRQLRTIGIAHYLPTVEKRTRVRAQVVTAHTRYSPATFSYWPDPEQRIQSLDNKRIVRCLEVHDQLDVRAELVQIHRLLESHLPVNPEKELRPGAWVEVRSGSLKGVARADRRSRGQAEVRGSDEFYSTRCIRTAWTKPTLTWSKSTGGSDTAATTPTTSPFCWCFRSGIQGYSMSFDGSKQSVPTPESPSADTVKPSAPIDRTLEPLTFTPYLRPMVWGSRRLETHLGKPLPPDDTYGESWEVSTHRHHISRVNGGELHGETLADVCRRHPRELFGDVEPPASGQFPLLVKFLDCHELLSVQVHPTDALAAQMLPGERGKTETWVVLAAEPGSKIFAGLLPGVNRDVLASHLKSGTVDRCLHAFTPRPGDCIHLAAGTVHGIGGGILLAEVQQSSDVTFRLFDWNRLGADGRPRLLHVEESFEAIDWSASSVGPVKPIPFPVVGAGHDGEHLVRCPHYTLNRYHLSSPLVTEPGANPPCGSSSTAKFC